MRLPELMPFKVFFSHFLVNNLHKNKNYLTFGCNIENR